MSPRETFERWKQQRRAVTPSADFADEVMRRVAACHVRHAPRDHLLADVLGWIISRPWAQAALIAVATTAAICQSLLLIRVGIG